jgi:hypothetical protein
MPFLPERCRHPPSSRRRLSPVRREKLPGTHGPRLFAVRLRLVMLLPARAPRVFPPLAPFMVELFAAALFLQAVAGSCHLPDVVVANLAPRTCSPRRLTLSAPGLSASSPRKEDSRSRRKSSPPTSSPQTASLRAFAQKVCLRRPSSTRQLSTGERERIG